MSPTGGSRAEIPFGYRFNSSSGLPDHAANAEPGSSIQSQSLLGADIEQDLLKWFDESDPFRSGPGNTELLDIFPFGNGQDLGELLASSEAPNLQATSPVLQGPPHASSGLENTAALAGFAHGNAGSESAMALAAPSHSRPGYGQASAHGHAAFGNGFESSILHGHATAVLRQSNNPPDEVIAAAGVLSGGYHLPQAQTFSSAHQHYPVQNFLSSFGGLQASIPPSPQSMHFAHGIGTSSALPVVSNAGPALTPRHSHHGSVDSAIEGPFGYTVSPASRHHSAPNVERQARQIDFGTDHSFSGNGFYNPSAHRYFKQSEERLLDDVKQLQPLDSAESTAPPSPVARRGNVQLSIRSRSNSAPGRSDRSNSGPAFRDRPDTSAKRQFEVPEGDAPAKRRKLPGLPFQHSAEEAPHATSADQAPDAANARRGAKLRARQASRDDSMLDSSLAGPSNSPTGSSFRAKAARENLTDEQKRQNHIISEQKRRAHIKDGYDLLHQAVPKLIDGQIKAKSQALVECADYLDDLLRGNRELERMLAEGSESEDENPNELAGEVT